MCSTSSLPLLSTRVASMLRTSNTSEGSRVMLALSSFLRGWSDLHDKVSGLPISHRGWWQREKSKHKRKRDQCCRWDNNLPHESFVESDSRARMSSHNHPKSRLPTITK